MGSSDIQSWIASTEPDNHDLESNDTELNTLRWENAQVNWNRFLEETRIILLSNKTKPRLRLIQEQLLPLCKHGDLSLDKISDIFWLITLTYPRYIDGASREAIESLGTELIQQENAGQRVGVVEHILGWLSAEVSRIFKNGVLSSTAPANLFVLLNWCCGIYNVCLQNEKYSSAPYLDILVDNTAFLLYSIMDPATHAKRAIIRSGVVRIKRAIESATNEIDILLLKIMARAKSRSLPIFFVPFLGIAIDIKLGIIQKSQVASAFDENLKTSILQLYVTSIIMSKTHVPPHVFLALHNFFEHVITSSDFTSFASILEKAILRSPETALPVITDLFIAYKQPLDIDGFRRILAQILNCTKSNNADVRIGSVRLFQALIEHNGDDTRRELVLNEVLSTPKSGKTSGPEHRISLYKILSILGPNSEISRIFVEIVPSLIAKETNDNVIEGLMSALTPHLAFFLETNEKLPDNISVFLNQSLSSIKPVLRKNTCATIGGALWGCFEKSIGIEDSLITAFVSSFESLLSSISSNPLNTDPLEGYVALSLLLGPLKEITKSGSVRTSDSAIQALLTSSPKPSFLLWDRVYQKAKNEDEQLWLLRALSLTLTKLDCKNEQIRVQIGLAFLHLAVASSNPKVRRLTIINLESEHRRQPHVVSGILRNALSVYLAHGTEGLFGNNTLNSKEQSLTSVLSVCGAFDISTSSDERRKLLTELIILAHHPLLNTNSKSQQIWIDICQKAKENLQELVSENISRLCEQIYEYTKSESTYMRKAALDAVTTLVIVAPAVALPKFLRQIQEDLHLEKLKGLSETDLAIWSTPEEKLYVDVLSSKKNAVDNKKGKNAELEKWEADVRKILQNKNPTSSPALSKADLAVVEKQLKTESKVRERVNLVKNDLLQGLSILKSAIKANVEEFHVNMWTTVQLLLSGVVKYGSVLVGDVTYNVYLELGACCSERLGLFKNAIGVATFRIFGAPNVPDDLIAEPIHSLILRVLYRIRSLAEQAVFDGATFSYIAPIISHVILTGGVVGPDDEPLEQVALALDFIKFHCGAFVDFAYPRKQVITDLIQIVRRHPQLGKDAASRLVEVGEAVHANATSAEISVLTDSVLSQEVYVRNAVLQCLQPFDLTDYDWSPELWIACHDIDLPNATLVRHIWDDNGLDVPETFFADLKPFFEYDAAFVRSSAASSLAEATEHWPYTVKENLAELKNLYREKAKLLAPEFDQYGILITESIKRADPWPVRVAIAQAFETLSPFLFEDQIEPFFIFLLDEEVLGDRNSEVRRGILEAASKIIDIHGTKRLQILISMFENCLATNVIPSETTDHVREAVVILLGRLARHMPPSDSRISGIVDRLVDALKIPSEQIQIAVSDCLTPLIALTKPSAPKLLDDLLYQLFNAPKYGERRGAAYGLAGIVKGLGIASLNGYNILEKLKTAMDDKKRHESRQGVMFALETLSSLLGRNFEPYIIQLLPLLLASFGDAVPDVREATQDAAKVIMGNLSGYGVKLILPTLLMGLEEKQWRTKKGSIELLGTMAFCSPKQLSLSLPTVIPRLTGVLTDSHAQVRSAANHSLKQFGEVINNPEVQSLVPSLLKALVDPGKTTNALSSLLKTSFMHYIDSPSLALLMPIIERGLRERSADTKKKAAQIVGNLASLTDSQDFTPYLSRLLPLVHVVLVDPVPEARATAAKALGTLIERLGEMHFPDLVPGLLRTLKTDTSGVDRQGAAQGLSEVLSGLGMERLEGLLPDIVSNAQSPRSTVREGFMSLLVYLPATFGSRFQPHLPKIVPPILSGLSDTEEYVRDAAMRAGRMIINNHSNKAIDLLLPELERSMFDSSWRIRHSSITLVGELLFKISGITGKTDIEEDEEDVTQVAVGETSRKLLLEALGKSRRDRVLASFYIIRQDSVHVVRQSGIHIWKVLVQNTPRTVRELLPELIAQVLSLITDQNSEAQETASRTVGELSRKFGEKVFSEIISILHETSQSDDSHTREGVCLAVNEIMQSATDNQLEEHDDSIVAIVRRSLVDDDAKVRAAAAHTFDILQEHLGPKAIDKTIPTLLEALRQPGESSGTALQALKEVMNVRANSVFPVLIPTLVTSPMTLFNARALATLVTVAGSALSRRLSSILNTIIKEQASADDEELRDAIGEAVRALLKSISDPEGLNTLMLLLLDWAKAPNPSQRVNACRLFGLFCEENELDKTFYYVDWVRELVSLLDDRQEEVHSAAWSAFDTFVKHVPKDELEPLVIPLRRAIESTGAPGRFVPGFSLPKSVAPMVPILVAGLITGSNEQREQAAYAIGDLVERTEENAIKPYVVPFTGPLIRVTTQAATYPPGVKSAILQALTTMLVKIPSFVKPFFPQLQRTFMKLVTDPSSLAVRNKASTALGALMKSQSRVDPVITELINGAKASDESIGASQVGALASVVRSASSNIGEKAREACADFVADAFKENHDEHYLQSVASLFASLSVFPAILKPLVQQYLLPGTLASVLSSHAILAVLSDDEEYEPSSKNLFEELGVVSAIQKKLQENIGSDKPSISRPAREAKELLKNSDLK